MGERFAKENGLTFLETSAKTSEHVEEAFQRSAGIIDKDIQSGVYDLTSQAHGIKIGMPSPMLGISGPEEETQKMKTIRGGCCRSVAVYDVNSLSSDTIFSNVVGLPAADPM